MSYKAGRHNSSRQDIYEVTMYLFAAMYLRANTEWHIDCEGLSTLPQFFLTFLGFGLPSTLSQVNTTLRKLKYSIALHIIHRHGITKNINIRRDLIVYDFCKKKIYFHVVNTVEVTLNT